MRIRRYRITLNGRVRRSILEPCSRSWTGYAGPSAFRCRARSFLPAAELARYLLDDKAPDVWVLEELDGEATHLRVQKELYGEVFLVQTWPFRFLTQAAFSSSRRSFLFISSNKAFSLSVSSSPCSAAMTSSMRSP